MEKTINVGGRLHNPVVGGSLTGANEIKDDTKGKMQNVINQETDAELLRLDGAKQDKMTFDQTPTENSTNPVTSGGVYAADAALQQAIEAILLLIPSAASALNQLADKSFVNSSIATATATFRGTYNLVADLGLTVSATHQQIATALASVVSTADNNDYCFVQIPVSESSTDIRVTERYKFDGTAWSYEYDLNNSGFTADQWAAINSGITSVLVGKLGALPTAAELATMFNGKQNTLTFDTTPTSGSNNPVTSGGLYAKFAAIDAMIPTNADANNKLVAESRLVAYVTTLINALDATFDVTSADGHVTLRMTQADGVITSVQVLTSDIASDAVLTSLGGRVSTAESDIDALQDAYAALTQSDVVIVNGTLPSSGQQQNIIYRQPDQDHTPPQFYSDYMWNGTTWVLMATYNNAIDPRPKKGSQNLVTSGGVFDNIGALDVSELNATENPHTLATYDDLSAALAAIPSDYQKGGMSIKFVQTSDNKYIQARCMAQNFTTDVTQWQCVDDQPTVGSENLVKSGGVYKFVEETGIIEQRFICTRDSYTSYPCLLSAGKYVLGLTNKFPNLQTGVYFFNSNGEQINNDSPLTVTENCFASVIYDLPEDCASVRIAGTGTELVIKKNGLAQEIDEIIGYERCKIIGSKNSYASYNCVLSAGKYVLELTNKLSAGQTGVYFFNSNNEQINYDSPVSANPNDTVLGVYNLPESCATVRIAGIGTELVISEYGLKGVENDIDDLKPKVYKIGKSDDNITIIRKNDVVDNNLLLLSDGTTGSYNGYYTSDYIPVTSNTYFCGNGIFVVSGNLRGYAVYDSEKTFIAAGGSENAEPYHVLPFNIKSRYPNAAFIRFSLADVDNRASFAIISEHGSGDLLDMERIIVEYASEISPIEKSIKPVIKTVKENGTVGTDCDFTDIKSALDSISDNSYNKQYVILVKNGTYDITGIDYLGLKNYVTIKGESRDGVVVRNSYPHMYLNVSCFDPAYYGDNIIEYASIEDITMRVNNGKCCVHIDGYSIVDGGKIRIKNCCLINEVENENGGINCGLRGGQTVEIDDCYGNCLAYAHTRNNPGSPANPNNFIIRNSCLTSIGFYDISDKVSDYKKNKLIVENCKCDYIGIGVSELASDKTKCSIEYIIDKNTIFNWVYIMGQNFIAGFDDWFSKYPICSSIHRFVSNNSGNTITKGTFVSILIQGGVPALNNTIPIYGYNITPYDGEHLYGIALEDIADGDSGIVQVGGKIFIPNNNYAVGEYIALDEQGQPIVGTKENAIGVVTNPDQPYIGQTLMLLTNTERAY